MAEHTPQAKLDLLHVTEERDQLAALLRDACNIIEASDDPDCEAWLSQARHALAKVGVKP
jgi:hypothetical protein